MSALGGRRVHVLSVNDYLARRDAEWMRAIFRLLGLEVSSVGQSTKVEDRRAAYRADIVYASFSEIGYDVLRDRQVEDGGEWVAPGFDVGVVDEGPSDTPFALALDLQPG